MELIDLGVTWDGEIPTAYKPLEDQAIVITGTLENYSRSDLKEKLGLDFICDQCRSNSYIS